MTSTHAGRPRPHRGEAGAQRWWSRLLPADATSRAGPRSAAPFLAASNVLATGRSLVHVIAPDSGAGTIASMATTGPGGANAFSLLAQWGASWWSATGA